MNPRPKPVRTPQTHTPISCDIVTRMKTTIDLPEELLRRAKAAARTRGTTLRAIVIESLHAGLASAGGPERYAPRDLRSGRAGDGLQPGIDLRDWDQIRAIIYEGRGE